MIGTSAQPCWLAKACNTLPFVLPHITTAIQCPTTSCNDRNNHLWVQGCPVEFSPDSVASAKAFEQHFCPFIFAGHGTIFLQSITPQQTTARNQNHHYTAAAYIQNTQAVHLPISLQDFPCKGRFQQGPSFTRADDTTACCLLSKWAHAVIVISLIAKLIWLSSPFVTVTVISCYLSFHGMCRLR